MTLFHGKHEPKPDRVLPSDIIARCPECSHSEAISIAILRTDVIRGGVVVSIPVGDRMACQWCPAVYSVGPNGVFRHHPGSLPITGEVRALPAQQFQPPQSDDPGLDPPLPRPKPRL